MGHGKSYDEAAPEYLPPKSDYDTLVWSDEFDGDKIDESKWQIIDGMWNHAIYNRKAVSIKKKETRAIYLFALPIIIRQMS